MNDSLWHRPGDKEYVYGVDRGMVYPHNIETGVPWNGLTSVNIMNEGAEVNSVYVDGAVVDHDVVLGVRRGSIQAFHYPEEFGAHCLGEKEDSLSGYTLHGQSLGYFDFSYRQRIANPEGGLLPDYKIYLVRNAIAIENDREFTTVSDETDPMLFSWDFDAIPDHFTPDNNVAFELFDMPKRPSAVMVVDTRKHPDAFIRWLEEQLYGETPRLPSLSDIYDNLGVVRPVVLNNEIHNSKLGGSQTVDLYRNLIKSPEVFLWDGTGGLSNARGWYAITTNVSSNTIINEDDLSKKMMHTTWSSGTSNSTRRQEVNVQNLPLNPAIPNNAIFRIAVAHSTGLIGQINLTFRREGGGVTRNLLTEDMVVSTDQENPTIFEVPISLSSDVNYTTLDLQVVTASPLTSGHWLAAGAITLGLPSGVFLTGTTLLEDGQPVSNNVYRHYEGANNGSDSIAYYNHATGVEKWDPEHQSMLVSSRSIRKNGRTSVLLVARNASQPEGGAAFVSIPTEQVIDRYVAAIVEYFVPPTYSGNAPQLSIYHRNGSDTLIANANLNSSGGWHREIVLHDSLIAQSEGSIAVRMSQGTSVPVGSQLYIDSVQMVSADTLDELNERLERSNYLGGYMDGDSEFDDIGRAEWVGERQQSRSILRSTYWYEEARQNLIDAIETYNAEAEISWSKTEPWNEHSIWVNTTNAEVSEHVHDISDELRDLWIDVVNDYFPDRQTAFSENEPMNKSRIWLQPSTGETSEYFDLGPGPVTNLVTNPRGRNTDGTVVVVEDYRSPERMAALEAAIGEFTDAPVQWSASAPVTDEVLPYAENLFGNPWWVADGGSYITRGEIDHIGGGFLRLTADETVAVPYMGQFVDVEPGQWLAFSVEIGWDDNGIGRSRHQVQFRASGESISNPQVFFEQSDVPDGGRITVAFQVPDGATEARCYVWGYLEGTTPPVPGASIRTGRWVTAMADTEAGARAAVAEYADGDSYGWEWDGEPHASTSHRPEQSAPRTDVTWVHPVTGVARQWSAGVGGSVDDVVRRNPFLNPSFETGTHGLNSGSGVPRLVRTASSNAVAVGNYAVNIETVGATGSSAWVSQDLDAVPEAGQWVAMSTATRRSNGATHAIHRFSFRDEAGSILSTVSSAIWELTTLPNAENPRNMFAAQVPPEVHSITATLRLHGSASGFSAPDDGWTNTDAWMAAIADTEAEALAAVGTYFDGDTPEHRTDNIIRRYAWEDEPHASPSTETALGQGWREITDPGVVAAIQQYQNYEDTSPDPDLELVGGNLIAPRPISYAATNGVVYYSLTRDTLAFRVDDANLTPFAQFTGVLGMESGGTYTTIIEAWSNDFAAFRAYVLGASPNHTGDRGDFVDGAAVIRRTFERTGSGAFVVVNLSISVNEPIAVGSTIYFRVALIVGEYEGAYGDGHTPGWAWDGTEDNSTSTYPGPGWQLITEPDIVQAGEDYVNRPIPGWYLIDDSNITEASEEFAKHLRGS